MSCEGSHSVVMLYRTARLYDVVILTVTSVYFRRRCLSVHLEIVFPFTI